MRYQWDSRKAAANRRKHGVEFADSTAVFEDELALLIEDETPDEERYIALGRDVLGRKERKEYNGGS
jgi:uncharacterized DUF497 family protein